MQRAASAAKIHCQGVKTGIGRACLRTERGKYLCRQKFFDWGGFSDSARLEIVTENPLRFRIALRETPPSHENRRRILRRARYLRILSWLKDTYSAEVIAFCADVGQEEELDGLERKSSQDRREQCYVDDLREERTSDFIFPMMQAGSHLRGRYFSYQHRAASHREAHGEIAAAEGTQAVTRNRQAGNDQVRSNYWRLRFSPRLERIAPWHATNGSGTISRPVGNDRLLRGEKHPSAGFREEAVFHGLQPSLTSASKAVCWKTHGRRLCS